MDIEKQATRINLLDWKFVQMRTFHLTWAAFFLCFFGWFGIAPLMAVVRDDLDLSKTQIGNTVIAAVAATILVRMIIGPLCDKFGPRRTYTALLLIGSLPVMLIGLAQSYEAFLLFRLAIGAIGASFVITQYHTAVMFAPNIVGTAKATTAGWGNLGGGVTQMVMPLIFAAVLMFGVSESLGWRLAVAVPGAIMVAMAFLYWRYTADCPSGDYRDLRAAGAMPPANGKNGAIRGFVEAAKDFRVWALFLIYGACFGVELTINNIAAIYFFDNFDVGLGTAGFVAGLFGLMNLFARTLGGMFSDRAGARSGLQGRVRFLFLVLLAEGVALMLFSQMAVLGAAVAAMIVFSLFTQMSEGATFGVVPFVNRRALGAVAGIVGAGGNAGAVAAGFLFRTDALTYSEALLYLGVAVAAVSFLVFLVRFSPESEADEARRLDAAVAAAG